MLMVTYMGITIHAHWKPLTGRYVCACARVT